MAANESSRAWLATERPAHELRPMTAKACGRYRALDTPHEHHESSQAPTVTPHFPLHSSDRSEERLCRVRGCGVVRSWSRPGCSRWFETWCVTAGLAAVDVWRRRSGCRPGCAGRPRRRPHRVRCGFGPPRASGLRGMWSLGERSRRGAEGGHDRPWEHRTGAV